MIKLDNNECIYEYNEVLLGTPVFDEIFTHLLNSGFADKSRKLLGDFFTLDIETSTVGKHTEYPIAFMYTCTIYIADKCIVFRRWKEYFKFISDLMTCLNLDDDMRLVCYIHNLPYEFQFMRTFMNVQNFFAVDKRKVVRCSDRNVEYRCSYKLTNMGLDKLCQSIPGVTHYKQSGEEFNYDKLRTPKSTLTKKEWRYIYNDVAGLYEAISIKMKKDGHTLSTIPATSTGYVRRELRAEMKANPHNREIFYNIRLDKVLYALLRNGRRGGNTHCNPLWSNQLLEDLISKDMSSAYPAVMVQCKFPMSRFMPLKDPSRFEDYLTGEWAMVLEITFSDIKVKTMATIPYIAKGICTQLVNIDSDNGRVLKASKLSMVMTDIDYNIIKDTYTWDKENTIIRRAYISKYDYLPDELRRKIIKQYYEKTTLKDGDEYFYMKAKNNFNADFGCLLTDICRPRIMYCPDSEEEPYKKEKVKDYSYKLNKYYESQSSFLSYQHGVWVTAHCRNRLQKAINYLKRAMVYCDTDSVKFFNIPSLVEGFEKLNDEIKQQIVECGIDCTVEYKGKKYTLGLWETDAHYIQFKSMGAKKYAYIDNYEIIKGKKVKVDHEVFHITVAGLSKSKARDYLITKGGMDAFHSGTLVPQDYSGRTTAIYNDWTKPKIIKIKGEEIEVGANLVISPTTYEFSLTEEYDDLLFRVSEGVYW